MRRHSLRESWRSARGRSTASRRALSTQRAAPASAWAAPAKRSARRAPRSPIARSRGGPLRRPRSSREPASRTARLPEPAKASSSRRSSRTMARALTTHSTKRPVVAWQSCGVSLQDDFDSLVAFAFVADARDADAANLADVRDVRAAAGLQVDPGNLQEAHAAGTAGRLHAHGLDELRAGVELL